MTNPDYRAELQLLFDAAESFTEPALGHHRAWEAAMNRARPLLAQPVASVDIAHEWRPCVKLPITVHVREQRPEETHISTREGITPLLSDDLIMLGVQGEEYPIGRELFEQTYRLRDSESQPPADGEVAELVRDLRHEADADARHDHTHWLEHQRLRRIADLLQRQHPQPVAVSERMPEPSVKVLAHYFNALGKGRTICAIWVPAKSRSDEGDLDADDFLEYDEENDKYHWPEGWYEAIENWEELGWAKVYEGEIAYWQPLPHWPANALPTPGTPNV